MPRFARGALPWLVVPGLLAAVFAGLVLAFEDAVSWIFGALAALALLVFLFFLQFFRDPERSVADGVASPADGKVVRIDEVEDADLGRCDRIAIFMSPKDVHVNRFPMDGAVVSVTHHAGGHIPAFNKDAHNNERVVTLLETALGRVKVIQIAGTVARRIVPYIQGGETARKGERFGLIRLGSRCDLLVPPGSVRWTVQLGQQVYGAKTSLGEPLAKPGPTKAKGAAKPKANAAGAPKAGKRKSKEGKA